MLDIKDIPACARYLMIATRRSQSFWEQECEAVRRWLATKPVTLSQDNVDAMLFTINSILPSDAAPVAVIHCYADVPSGSQYDVVFDPNDPDLYEPTSAEVLFGVAFSRYVDSTLSHGHHQTAVLRFPNGMPALVDRLPWDTITSDYVCLCAAADFAEIRGYQKVARNGLLNNFLADPISPRWSSHLLQQMFADIEGDPRQQLLAILPLIDERMATTIQSLTDEQFHFLRSVTLHVYPSNTVRPTDLFWLTSRFRSVPTQQRALIIAMLLPLVELPQDIQAKMRLLLKDTRGAEYITTGQADDSSAT